MNDLQSRQSTRGMVLLRPLWIQPRGSDLPLQFRLRAVRIMTGRLRMLACKSSKVCNTYLISDGFAAGGVTLALLF